MASKAVIICVGDELLQGRVTDANSQYLREQLDTIGWKTSLMMTVADSRSAISSALGYALSQGELIILAGGLGPTADDLTREGVADALGRRLVRNGFLEQRLKRRFESMGREMPPSNLRQADVLEGNCEIIEGRGTAPGLLIKEGEKIICLLPGVPSELRLMVENFLLPFLSRISDVLHPTSREISFFGCTEAEVGEIVESMLPKGDAIKASYLAKEGVIQVRLWGEASDAQGMEKSLDELVEKICQRLSGAMVSADGRSLEEVLMGMMVERGATLAVAESCTGGLIGERVTRVPGSSQFFLGGVISYDLSVKTSLLRVDQELIREKGVVSREVAEAMARGVRSLMGADFSISTTGVAGPGGGSVEVPVGTVCIGLSAEEGEYSWKLRLPGERDLVRGLAANAALMSLILHLRGKADG